MNLMHNKIVTTKLSGDFLNAYLQYFSLHICPKGAFTNQFAQRTTGSLCFSTKPLSVFCYISNCNCL